MNNKPKIPAGWYRLRKGTVIERGDKFWFCNSLWSDDVCYGERVGMLYGYRNSLFYIRLKPRAKK